MTPHDAPDLPDLGFFGPDSVTWKVHSDPVMLLGGLRALLLQALHPLAMTGLHQHSGFRQDPWGRLARTAEYVTLVGFAPRAEVERRARKVRAIHARLKGTLPDGTVFPLDRPDLLLWVHLCEVESFLSTALRAGLRLTSAEQDRYYEEQRIAAALVGLDPASVPGSVAEVAAYFDSIQPELELTPYALAAAKFVVFPPQPRLLQVLTPARPGWAALALTSLASLPPWARRLYGLPGLSVTDRGANWSLRLVRLALSAVPTSLRTSPIVKEATARATALPD